jgi:mono/diheme cytochrome c family protein
MSSVRVGFVVLALLALAPFAIAQDDIPPAISGRGGRGGGGNTREFLGLGPAPDAAAAARGESLYTPNCGFCHGEKARGAGGPNLVRSEVVLHDEKGETIGAVVSQGRADKGMPAFPNLTKEQLYDLSQFLHMQVELVANRGLYKRLNVVTGNAKSGEAYFTAHCASCHSVTGDLAHVGTRYQPEALQSRFIWPAGRGGGGRGGRGGATPSAPKITVTLANGQTIAGTLKRLDDADVSFYDSAGNYRSFPRAEVKVEQPDPLAGHRALLETLTDSDMHNLTAYLVTIK